MINELKYRKYMEEFKRSFPNSNITDKSYKVTLVRHIMMYFLYLEKRKKNSITYDEIAGRFSCKKSNVCLAIKQIKHYNTLNNYKQMGVNKNLFRYFYFRYKKIYNNNNNNNHSIN